MTNIKNIPINQSVIPWIVISLALVIIPHIPRLPLWLSVFIFIILSVKFFTFKKTKIVIGKLPTFALTILAIFAVIVEYSKLFGRDASVSLLIVMLFLKLIETKTYRDGMVVISMTYFLVITNFLYTQSIPTALYMIVAVLLITATLITLNQKSRIRLIDKLKTSAIITLQATPIMIALFVLFPRIPGPLWGLPSDAYSGKTGLSENMTPGNISNLVLSDEVAFRVKFNKDPPATHNLYWRALVLWEFDGRTWHRGKHKFMHALPFRSKNPIITYTVTLEPHNRHWMFTLDRPSVRTKDNSALPLDSDYLLFSKRPVINLKKYTASSYINPYSDMDLIPDKLVMALQLPMGYNPRAITLAEQWSEIGHSPEEIVNLGLKMFTENNFIYSLRPPTLGFHSVDEFLFSTRKGFCEHFASSYVFLMRAAGIPARVVTGYQGAEINPIDDYMIIRQSDAHAWAEVWLQGRGWVRVDPTAMVSPQRIETNLDSAISFAENPRFTLRHNNPLISNLALVWDAVNNRWNQWVLGYNPEVQNSLLSYFGFSEPNPHNLVFMLTIVLAVLILATALLILRSEITKDLDLTTVLYLKYCKKLKNAGLPRYIYEGPIDYKTRIITLLPENKNEITAITNMYAELKYNSKLNIEKLNEFKNQVNKFLPSKT